MNMRLTTLPRPIRVVVVGIPPGDTLWADTAWAVRTFKPVREGSAPDTVRFDLRESPQPRIA
jgi:hypothetical protein